MLGNTMDLKKHIENIIKNAIEKTDAIYETNQEKDKAVSTFSSIIVDLYFLNIEIPRKLLLENRI